MRDVIARLRGYYYKLLYQVISKKAIIGRNFLTYCKMEITGPGKVQIGNNCVVQPNVFGEHYVTLYTHAATAIIIIADGTILRGTRMGCFTTIEIGRKSVIEEASIFDSDFHNINALKRDEEYQQYNKPVKIEQNCYIGLECLIGKGSELGANCICLPGTVLSMKSIKPGSFVGGLPGRVLNETSVNRKKYINFIETKRSKDSK